MIQVCSFPLSLGEELSLTTLSQTLQQNKYKNTKLNYTRVTLLKNGMECPLHGGEGLFIGLQGGGNK